VRQSEAAAELLEVESSSAREPGVAEPVPAAPAHPQGWSWDLPAGSETPPRLNLSVRTVAVVALAVLALVLWVVALPSVEPARISGWGLLTALPLAWYAAYVLALAAMALVFVGRFRLRLLLAAAAPLFLVLFATTSVVYGAPRYPWTYKHLGVIEYLAEYWKPALDLDIYQNFPGFFYLMAILHSVTHIPLQVMAEYSELGASVLNAIAFYWAAGALVRSRATRAFAVVLFTLTNWIGQSYFSPQALAYPAALFVIGAFLRLIALGHGRPRTSVPWFAELQRPSAFWGRPSSLVLVTVAFEFVVVSHQFTPIAILVQMAALAVVFLLRRPWLLVLFGVLTLLWLIHAYPYISSHFSIFDFSGYANLAPPEVLAPALPGSVFMAHDVPRLLVAFHALATLVAAGLSIRRTRSVRNLVLPGLLAASPVLIVVVQPYGQEGIYRFYLFAIPWCCLVIARELFVLSRTRWRVWVGVAAVLAIVGSLAPLALYRNELVNYVYPQDVATDQWFEVNTPTRSELLLLVPAFPARSTGSYPRHIVLDDPLSPALLHDVPGFTGSANSGADLLAFTKEYVDRQKLDHDVYLSIGPTQFAYARLYGLVGAEAYQDYLDRLRADPAFRLAYQNGDSYLFKAS